MFKSLALVFLAFFVTATLSAQATGAAPVKKVKTASKANIEANEAKGDEDLARELNLTAEQKAAFKKAGDEYKAQSKEAKNARKEERERLRAERVKAQRAVLTADQLKKYDELNAKKEAHRNHKQAQKAEHKEEKKAMKTEKKENKAENKAIKNELHKQ